MYRQFKNTVRKNVSPLCHCYGNVGEAIFFSDLSCKFQFLSLALKMNVARTVDPFGLGSKFFPRGGGDVGCGSFSGLGCTFRDHSTMERANQWSETNSVGKLKKASRTSDISTHLTDGRFLLASD